MCEDSCHHVSLISHGVYPGESREPPKKLLHTVLSSESFHSVHCLWNKKLAERACEYHMDLTALRVLQILKQLLSRHVKVSGKAQSVLVSGESGSGKTQTCRYLVSAKVVSCVHTGLHLERKRCSGN